MNPFKPGTKQARLFEILSDLEWHCGKHELPGTQPAKAIQILRQHGYVVENQTQYCDTCSERTVHRKLLSTDTSNVSKIRMQFPEQLRRRVLRLYNNVEAITFRELRPEQLEVDHRFPQVRWSKDESIDPDITDSEIRDRFQLLTRANNLWKSRYCEHCVRTGERGTYIGINYFYQGTAKWSSSTPDDDSRGCIGCFWYDPETWRNSLNELLSRSL